MWGGGQTEKYTPLQEARRDGAGPRPTPRRSEPSHPPPAQQEEMRQHQEGACRKVDCVQQLINSENAYCIIDN